MVRLAFTSVNPLSPRLSLVGETTRRDGLNLDRGSGPLDAQHNVRKREPHRGISAKVAYSRMAPKVISLRDSCRRTPSTPRRIHQRSLGLYSYTRGYMNIKSNAEAFELALWLAITAETEEQSRSAIDLAIEVGSKIPREQCEAIKLKVERAIAEETGHVH